MTDFPLHDIDSAPAAAKPKLEGARKAMGFIPNIFAKMAEAPAVLEGYMALSDIFDRTSLSPVEREVVLLTTSVEHDCRFCVAAHSGRARKAGMDDAVLEALRAGEPLPDRRLQALHAFTLAVVRQRGWVDDAAVEELIEAGFERGQALEVVLGVSMKVLSNYTNHIAGTPVNAELEPFKWEGKTG
ncbi:carboxymuconolactone decarboxylase family protein [Arhodomonas aquaeolei]|uniref:carboxymuconolactone decarboxylase family protein n=1 Tax=Arhodomonas aquaeolei TaxID=2369 RepID=UPI00037322A5|nr:carboxymuconolactone decarboxylase family protein [Arhodomonas aquaeolei]